MFSSLLVTLSTSIIVGSESYISIRTIFSIQIPCIATTGDAQQELQPRQGSDDSAGTRRSRRLQGRSYSVLEWDLGHRTWSHDKRRLLEISASNTHVLRKNNRTFCISQSTPAEPSFELTRSIFSLIRGILLRNKKLSIETNVRGATVILLRIRSSASKLMYQS